MLTNATVEKLSPAMAIVTLSGPLTLGSSLKLVDSQVQSAITEGVVQMVFDLSSVDFMDSAGLGMMVCAFGALNEKSGSLRLCQVAPRVRSLLALTKTDTFLPIDGSREDSIAAFPA